jgi:hypothetical protein
MVEGSSSQVKKLNDSKQLDNKNHLNVGGENTTNGDSRRLCLHNRHQMFLT